MVVAELAGAVGWLLVLLADRPVTLVLFALLATAANAPFKAAASASVPNLVAADDLPWANGTIATATNASLLVGPLLGGALVGAAGPQAVYALNVVSFLVSALVIARLRGTFAAAGADRADGAGGRWRTVAADRQRRRLFAVTALDVRRLRGDVGRGSPLGRPPRGWRNRLCLADHLVGHRRHRGLIDRRPHPRPARADRADGRLGRHGDLPRIDRGGAEPAVGDRRGDRSAARGVASRSRRGSRSCSA